MLMNLRSMLLKLGPNQPIFNKCVVSLVLAGFYHRFVKDFSTIASPLHALSKKNAPFVWGPSQDSAFNELKNFDTHAPVLALPNFDKPLKFIVTLVVMA